MIADITELNNTLNITHFLNETVSRTLTEKFSTPNHNLDISMTDSVYEQVSLLNIKVTHYKSDNYYNEPESNYSFNLRIRLRIKEQNDTAIGIHPDTDCMNISTMTYVATGGPVTTTKSLRINKARNLDGMYTYEDIAQTIVEIITAIRHRAV